MLIRYIRNDLEGVYTAEMLRGSISMLAGVAFYELSGPGAAGAYILIIALYGLRALAGKTLIRRLLSMAASLILLSAVLFSGIFFGHERLIVPQALLTCLLSAATVYCLARLKDFSGTVMFMSIFEVVAFGMGLIDRGREVTAEGLLTACAAGSVSVLLAVLLVPFTRFHWCGMINRCFYHDLRLYALMMGSSEFYESFTDLPQERKSRILALQSALLNTSEHVLDPVRRGRYQSILNGLILICYWPTAGTEKEHIARINRIRSGIFSCVAGMLAKGRNSSSAAAAADGCRRMLSAMPEDRFCNGEMTRHALRVLDDLTSLLREDRGYEYGAAMTENRTGEGSDVRKS